MSDSPVLGSITPRLSTSPLVTGAPGPCGCGCALTPATSYGFAAVDFATTTLKRPPWPWQRWFMIHAGELSDGLPRFRTVVNTVGRQSGKTRGVMDLSLFWLFGENRRSILGTSTLTKYAKKPWMDAFKTARSTPALFGQMFPLRRDSIRTAAGEEEWWTVNDCHYAVAASNSEGGRSMSNERVIADELAKQYNYEAYSAAYYSMDAFEDAQYFGLTTPDPRGIVWLDLRNAALKYIDTGEGDPGVGLFEWSVPKGADPLDPRMLAMANPTFGRPGGKDPARMLRQASGAVAKGGELLRSFQAEVMCELLEDEDAAINLEAWSACLERGTLEKLRARLALVFDVAPSMQHATLYAAAELPDGRVRIEPIEAWQGAGCADRAARELPALVGRVRPRAFGWLPSGPAAAVGAQLSRSRRGWPVPGVAVQELRGEMTQISMGFSQLVDALKVAHSGDPLLDEDVKAAEKLPRGDGWTFSRRGNGDCDALYAAAGAVWLAQTLPVAVGGTRVLLPTVR